MNNVTECNLPLEVSIHTILELGEHEYQLTRPLEFKVEKWESDEDESIFYDCTCAELGSYSYHRTKHGAIEDVKKHILDSYDHLTTSKNLGYNLKKSRDLFIELITKTSL